MKQEPVAWRKVVGNNNYYFDYNDEEYDEPLYLEPPEREWIGLTADEVWEIFKKHDPLKYMEFAIAIEAKLKEKNT